MGFLGEIERVKQQQIQQELTRKAEVERQRQLAVQNAEDKKKRAEINANRIERDAISYIQDRLTIAGLVDQLNEFGYRDYFEEVARISGFQLKQGFYTKYQRYEASVNPEVVKQQLEVRRKLEDASSQLGWPKGMDNHSPDVMFFGDNLRGKAEPKEIGIGIRFSKQIKSRKGFVEDRKDKHRGYYVVIKQWHHNAYVRIDSQSKATITGSNQRQVYLRDLRLFDEVLEQVIHDPAKVYTKNTSYETFSSSQSSHDGPCFPGNSLISVPDGFVPVKNLKSGDLVWTVDKFGNKVKSVIVQKTKRRVSKDHKMAHIVLEDGRELIVSPGHPTIENREIGNLLKGQILDKSQIVSVQIMPHKEKYTYDILPSGDTGGYWANNILIGSTLSNQFKEIQWYRQLFV